MAGACGCRNVLLYKQKRPRLLNFRSNREFILCESKPEGRKTFQQKLHLFVFFGGGGFQEGKINCGKYFTLWTCLWKDNLRNNSNYLEGIWMVLDVQCSHVLLSGEWNYASFKLLFWWIALVNERKMNFKGMFLSFHIFIYRYVHYQLALPLYLLWSKHQMSTCSLMWITFKLLTCSTQCRLRFNCHHVAHCKTATTTAGVTVTWMWICWVWVKVNICIIACMSGKTGV